VARNTSGNESLPLEETKKNSIPPNSNKGGEDGLEPDPRDKSRTSTCHEQNEETSAAEEKKKGITRTTGVKSTADGEKKKTANVRSGMTP